MAKPNRGIVLSLAGLALICFGVQTPNRFVSEPDKTDFRAEKMVAEKPLFVEDGDTTMVFSYIELGGKKQPLRVVKLVNGKQIEMTMDSRLEEVFQEAIKMREVELRMRLVPTT